MSLSIEDILAKAKRPEDIIPLCLRGDLVAEYERLDRQLATASKTAASLGEPSPAAEIAARMAGLYEQMTAAQVEFKLRAMGAKPWSDFFATRPDPPIAQDGKEITKAERDRYATQWHAWVCELVAAACYDPVMTAEQVAELAAELSDGQWKQLSDGAYDVNTGQKMLPFSDAASAILQATEPK